MHTVCEIIVNGRPPPPFCSWTLFRNVFCCFHPWSTNKTNSNDEVNRTCCHATLHSACWPDTSVLVRARWSLPFIGVQEEWLVLLVTAALLKQKLTVTPREIDKRKVGREEEIKAGKYKLFLLYESDTDRNNKFHICGSFPRRYFSSISLPLPTVEAGTGTRQFPLIHRYIIILQSSNNLSSTTFLF
jgi:hypothetical protein